MLFQAYLFFEIPFNCAVQHLASDIKIHMGSLHMSERKFYNKFK